MNVSPRLITSVASPKIVPPCEQNNYYVKCDNISVIKIAKFSCISLICIRVNDILVMAEFNDRTSITPVMFMCVGKIKLILN
jgi:hypothetical protein